MILISRETPITFDADGYRALKWRMPESDGRGSRQMAYSLRMLLARRRGQIDNRMKRVSRINKHEDATAKG